MGCALDEHRPVFGNRHLAIQSRRDITGLDVDGDVEVTGGFAAKDAVRGGNIGVVATDGGADVPVVCNKVIGGIKTNPAKMRHEHVDPGMAGVGGRTVVIFATSVEIAGDVASGDANKAQQSDHGVGEILTDSAPIEDGLVDG